MEPLSYLNLATDIHDRYARYLQTLFQFRDEKLRRSFKEALGPFIARNGDATEPASYHLAKGPFLEAMPLFSRGQRTHELATELLGSTPASEFLEAIDGERRLYSHQETAWREVAAGRNVLVATGTGSGKTEAFLYPILLHLFQEHLAGTLDEAGVRALILYPMNALANDQRERLGDIARKLEHSNSDFRFTFGQYIGRTPEDKRDSSRLAGDCDRARCPGEKVFREEMRKKPPHILLTNYSMLEYLLIRPDDSPLFDDDRARHWKFLVLDEAHLYRGAKGAEMGLLLRRLKQRLRVGGRTDSFQCVATSATLVGQGEEAAAAKFASDLFGEPFDAAQILLGKTEPLGDRPPNRLALDEYQAMERKYRQQDDHVSDLYQTLQGDQRLHDLRKELATGPQLVGAVADTLFPDAPSREERLASIERLSRLAVKATHPHSGAPALALRFHFFLRSLEGCYVSFCPEIRMSLNRMGEADNRGAEAPESGRFFELALCRNCGAHFFVAHGGFWRERRIREPEGDLKEREESTAYLLPHEICAEDDGESESNKAVERLYTICLWCGSVSDGRKSLTCQHASEAHLKVVDANPPKPHETTRKPPRKCLACGYRSPKHETVQAVLHGHQGPQVVIGTTLHERLPEDRRKVLAFADNRQDAAFYAWYMDESYRELRERQALWRALPEDSSLRLTLAEWADRVQNSEQQAAFRSAESEGAEKVRRRIWERVAHEMLRDAPGALDRLGLVEWSFDLPSGFDVPPDLFESPWSLSREEASVALGLLLESLRRQEAVSLCFDGRKMEISRDDIGLEGRTSPAVEWAADNKKQVRSWCEGPRNRRQDMLVRLLRARDVPDAQARDAAVDLLRKIWDTLLDQAKNAGNDRDPILVHRSGGGMQINPEWIRVRRIDEKITLYRCSSCGRVRVSSVLGVCPHPTCQGGRMVSLSKSDAEENHYTKIYRDTQLPPTLVVEEHTAQIVASRAEELQRRFQNGKVHVLSCSTTFEVGVDLGDLDTIFLRNVPPEAFNYSQRVGRAGRRARPGFVVTFCARKPHDLYHYHEPNRMLQGKISAPSIVLDNEKIAVRHIVAVALSDFFRDHPERFKNVKGLLGDTANPELLPALRAHLQNRRTTIEAALALVLPAKLHGKTGITNGTWIDRIVGKDESAATSRLADAVAETSADYRQLNDIEAAATGAKKYDDAKWCQSRRMTIEEEDSLSFLSRKAVIPKYGFPVDVVELDTLPARSGGSKPTVSLQRDLSLAIAEYAPTCEVLADKKLWKSHALKRVPEREWERWHYARCALHGRFHRWRIGEAHGVTEACCETLSGDLNAPKEYVIPRFGFTVKKGEESAPPDRMPRRTFSTRPYFIGFDGSSEPAPRDVGPLKLTPVSPGRLVVVCEGLAGGGFRICTTCGAGVPEKARPHYSPLGRTCPGKIERLGLGHEFVTDVLRLSFPSYGDFAESDKEGFAHGLSAAIQAGAATTLVVPQEEVGATLGHDVRGGGVTLYLYDRVPGGAGLVARLGVGQTLLRGAIDLAYRLVDNRCGCAPDTSCYGCLRSYRNQYVHAKLRRGVVRDYLHRLLVDPAWETS